MSPLIRPLAAGDVDEAARIVRVAFGTHFAVAEPEAFRDDRDAVRTRWRANPDAALGACVDRRLVGCVLAANWGSVGWFGPLCVLPDRWGQGVAQSLLAPTMDLFARWGTRAFSPLPTAPSISRSTASSVSGRAISPPSGTRGRSPRPQRAP